MSEVSDRSLIARHDSTLSAIRCLLGSSQEEASQESTAESPADTPVTSVSATSCVDTSQDADLSSTVTDEQTPNHYNNSAESQQEGTEPETKTDQSCGGEQQPRGGDCCAPPVKEAPTHSTPSCETSPEPQETNMQDKPRGEDTDKDNEVIEETDMEKVHHSEHMSLVLSNAKDRVWLRTRSPRLWRHGCQLYETFCSYSGIDDGQRLAATGIVWKIFGSNLEVVFTGSLGWSNSAGRGGNKRSHKVNIPGPHFVFVRPAALLGKPIKWSDLQKLHVQTFFLHGEPNMTFYKATLVQEDRVARKFLSRVDDPKNWFNITLLQSPTEKPQLRKTRKRSRRILELQVKNYKDITTMSQAKKREDRRRDNELKVLRAEIQRHRRDRQKLIDTSVSTAVAKMKTQIEKAVLRKMQKQLTDKFKEVSKPLQIAVDNVDDMSKQLDDDKNEINDKMDSQDLKFDRLFKELDDKVQNVVDVVNILKQKAENTVKRNKKLQSDVNKFSKKVEKMAGRINRASRAPNRTKRRRRSVDKQAKHDQPVQDTATVVEGSDPVPVTRLPQTSVVAPRPPTPMVPLRQNNPWFHVGDTRAVSPTPQFISPMYASRNFMR